MNLEILKQIPKGKVTTYKALSIVMKKKGAHRCIGHILHENKDYLIPCYKVVRSDGSVGNYNRGKREKIELLKKDGIEIKNGKIVNFEKHLMKAKEFK